MALDTFDGTLDKRQGSEFSISPAPWNQETSAGTKRVVHFKVTPKSNKTEIVLVSIKLNGGDEIR